jgi:CheY-like chemotaxis protein
VLFDAHGVPRDYRFIDVNDAFAQHRHPAEMLQTVFDAFVQQTAIARPRERRARTRASSAGVNHGSTFIIELPAVEASGAAVEDREPGRADAPADGPKTRVLVVDDNEDSANMLRDALVRRGHAVEVAVDGPSALARAVIFRPDTVLLDIGLPMMDGYEVTRRLRSVRAQEGASPPRPFAVTGYGQDADRQRAVEAGSSDAW